MCELTLAKMVFYPPCDIPVLECKAENFYLEINC